MVLVRRNPYAGGNRVVFECFPRKPVVKDDDNTAPPQCRTAISTAVEQRRGNKIVIRNGLLVSRPSFLQRLRATRKLPFDQTRTGSDRPCELQPSDRGRIERKSLM